MAQHDYVIANGTGAAVRSDLNNGLSAIVTQNSGATEPATTYAFMRWADTTAGVMKMRNSANNAWITLYQLDGEWTNIAFENGTAAAPSIYFKDSGTDTGFYSPGANQVGISTGGTARLTIDSNGNVDIDSNTLYVDATNNRVGLGTSSPDANSQLHVVGSSYQPLYVNTTGAGGGGTVFLQSGTQALYTGTAGSGWLSGSAATDGLVRAEANLILATNGNTRAITIDSSQRVGIGVTAPQAALHVIRGLSNTAPAIAIGEASNNVRFGIYQEEGYTGTVIGNANIDLKFKTFADAGTGGALSFWTGTTTATERARIDSSGRLLVGTSTSTAAGLLQVQGNQSNSAGSGDLHLRRGEAATSITSGEGIGYLSFTDNAGGQFAYIGCEADATAGSGDYPGRLVFSTTADGASSPTERMRITNQGYVKASNTGTYTDSSGASRLTADAHFFRNDQNFLTILATNTNTGSAVEGFTSDFVTGATGTHFIGSVNLVRTFIVAANGNVTNTNNSYGAISDIKLKENIVDANSQWDDIKALQVRNYNFKEGQTHAQIGLIAQEVELISPGLVGQSPDLDKDGNDLGTVTKSVNYSVLYMKAVKALQEAMERIETLEAKVAALEAR